MFIDTPLRGSAGYLCIKKNVSYIKYYIKRITISYIYYFETSKLQDRYFSKITCLRSGGPLITIFSIFFFAHILTNGLVTCPSSSLITWFLDR